MTKIHPVEHTGSGKAPKAAKPARRGGPGPKSAGPTDIDEIIAASALAAKARELPEVRAELVERIKAEIAAGKYETPERIEAAVNGLLADLLGEE
jgi:anti-sigma28 factor (negative regulator of flagellin synthesis)